MIAQLKFSKPITYYWMTLSAFRLTFVKLIPNCLQQPARGREIIAMSQLEFREQTSRLLVALKNAINQVAIGFRLKSYWLERKLAFSGPITEQNKQKKKQSKPMLLRVLIWKSAPINVTKKTKQNKNEYIICSGNYYKYLIRFENLQTQFWSIRRLNYKICLLINLLRHISFFQRSTCRCCSTSEVIQA